jgi:hypothetical protein
MRRNSEKYREQESKKYLEFLSKTCLYRQNKIVTKDSTLVIVSLHSQQIEQLFMHYTTFTRAKGAR